MRRVFLRNGEIPELLAGVATGKPAALRRILGARRGGRVGVALGIAGLLLAFPVAYMPWVAAAQLALGFAGVLARPSLDWREYERLSLWAAGAVLIATSVIRLVADIPATHAALALAAHAVLLWRLRRGALAGPAR
jgi:hypothetical protein